MDAADEGLGAICSRFAALEDDGDGERLAAALTEDTTSVDARNELRLTEIDWL
jgi:hypothetical protein